MIRAVIDTNVLVSAMLSPRGNERLVLLAIEQNFIEPCFSSSILLEYLEVLGRRKFSFAQDEITTLIQMFRSHGASYESETSPISLPDPDDEKFVSCAVAAKAPFIVTGNRRHFGLLPIANTKVVNAGQFLDYVTREP